MGERRADGVAQLRIVAKQRLIGEACINDVRELVDDGARLNDFKLAAKFNQAISVWKAFALGEEDARAPVNQSSSNSPFSSSNCGMVND